MNLEEKMPDFFLSKVKEVHRFLSEEVEYDGDAITYDENGKVLEIINKIPREVVESKKSTCMGGVFYSARELRNDFGEEMISFAPIVQKSDFKPRLWYFHGMYLFNLNGFYGAISKSREELLSFVGPNFVSVRSLVLSPQILRGYNNVAKSRGEKFLGIAYLTGNIRERFPNYEFDVTQIPVEGMRESIKGVRFDALAKKNPKNKEYFERVLQ